MVQFLILSAVLLYTGSAREWKLTRLSFVQCGKRVAREKTTSKIFNGHKVTTGRWPWQGRLCLFDANLNECVTFCGATLIHNQWMLTAAHCIMSKQELLEKKLLYKVELGGVREMNAFEEGKLIVSVSDIHIRRDFNKTNLENDIALIKLSKPVQFTDDIRPICLSSSENNTVSTRRTAYVIGWGIKNENISKPAPILMETAVTLVSNNRCDRAYESYDSEIMLCAYKPNTGICAGDSGGPLMTKHDVNGRWYQVGLASGGIRCGWKEVPASKSSQR